MSGSASGVAPTTEVSEKQKSIFRSKALRSYADREQLSAPHELRTSRSLYLVWVLLAVVVFLGAITWRTEIPVYTSAVAVTVDARGSKNETTAEATFVIFVPAGQLNKLRVGQNVIFKPGATPQRVIARIFAIEPDILSPQAAQKRFDPGSRFSTIAESKAIALARLVSPVSMAFLKNDRGGLIEAWVQTDSRPVISLFPMMGRVVSPSDEQKDSTVQRAAAERSASLTPRSSGEVDGRRRLSVRSSTPALNRGVNETDRPRRVGMSCFSQEGEIPST